MRYIIHVVDDASQHEKKNSQYTLVQGISQEESKCDILRTDAFYIVESENAIDAITLLSNAIKVKTNTGEHVLLSESFKETHKNNSITDFGSDSKALIDDFHLKVVTASYSESYMASCQIPMKKDGEEWIELHKVYFYVLEENKIVEIQGEENDG